MQQDDLLTFLPVQLYTNGEFSVPGLSSLNEMPKSKQLLFEFHCDPCEQEVLRLSCIFLYQLLFSFENNLPYIAAILLDPRDEYEHQSSICPSFPHIFSSLQFFTF